MLRLFRLALGSILLMAVGVGVARFVGSAQPSALAGLFTNSDGRACDQPCLFGVHPGETHAAEAIALLKQHPLTHGFTSSESDPYRFQAEGDRIVMISFNPSADGLVADITLVAYVRYGPYNSGAPSMTGFGALGDLLSIFGTPDFVQLTTGGDPVLGYAQHGMEIASARARPGMRRITADDELRRIVLFKAEKCSSDAFAYMFPRWLGFAHFSRYSRAPTIETMVRRLNSPASTFAVCKP
jgi:hypothetical protein